MTRIKKRKKLESIQEYKERKNYNPRIMNILKPFKYSVITLANKISFEKVNDEYGKLKQFDKVIVAYKKYDSFEEFLKYNNNNLYNNLSKDTKSKSIKFRLIIDKDLPNLPILIIDE